MYKQMAIILHGLLLVAVCMHAALTRCVNYSGMTTCLSLAKC